VMAGQMAHLLELARTQVATGARASKSARKA
jgi:hypothetical protein